MQVKIYRSPRKDGMYLFVPEQADVTSLPEALMQRFGSPVEAMVLELTPERKLARADAREVLAQIEAQGFYLQLPPPEGSDPLLGRSA